MSKKKPKSTSLWALVDKLQQRLDSLGLDSRAVDDVVTRKVLVILAELDDPPGRVPWSYFRTPAQA